MNKRKNIRTDELKEENYIPLGINAGGIMNEEALQASHNTPLEICSNCLLDDEAFLFFIVRVDALRPRSTAEVMSGQVIYPNHTVFSFLFFSRY